MRPQRTGFRPESADLRLVKSLFEGEINEQTDEETKSLLCPTVLRFHQTAAPSPPPKKNRQMRFIDSPKNKAGYTSTLVACGWAGSVLQKVTRTSGQERYARKPQKRQKK